MKQPLMLTVLDRCLFYLHALRKCSYIGALQVWSWQKACKRGDAIHYVLFFSKFVPILHFSPKFKEIISLFHGKRLIITSKVYRDCIYISIVFISKASNCLAIKSYNILLKYENGLKYGLTFLLIKAFESLSKHKPFCL